MRDITVLTMNGKQFTVAVDDGATVLNLAEKIARAPHTGESASADAAEASKSPPRRASTSEVASRGEFEKC